MQVAPYQTDLYPGRVLTTQDILEAKYVDYNPTHSIVRNSPIEIIIPRLADDVIDFKHCSLFAIAKITKADGSAPDADKVGPCNNTLHSLWKTVTIHLNGTNISGPGEHYHYRAYLEDLLSYNPEAFTYQLQMQMWNNDKEGKFEDAVTAGAGHNDGLVKRAAYFNTGKSVRMVGRLHSDVFNQTQCLIPYVEMRVTLTPNNDNVLLTCADNIAYQMHIVKCFMRMHQYRLVPESKNELLKVMQRTPIPYQIKHSRVHPLTIPANVSDHLATISLSGPVPSRIVLGMLSQACFTGGYATNPFFFQHFTVNYMELKVNGKVFPSSGPIECNFETKDALAAYYQLYESMSNMPAIKPIAITLDQFMDGFTFFAFDLTRQHNPNSLDTYPEVAPVDLRIKFTKAPTNAIYALIYDETDKYFMIDNSFNVINPI